MKIFYNKKKDLSQKELIEKLALENIKLKDLNTKFLISHTKLSKLVETMVKDIKLDTGKATDEQIISSWNSGIPKEFVTTDINVALRGSRKTMNSITLQGLNELTHILNEGKTETRDERTTIRNTTRHF